MRRNNELGTQSNYLKSNYLKPKILSYSMVNVKKAKKETEFKAFDSRLGSLGLPAVARESF